MTIYLHEILLISAPEEYKIHFAQRGRDPASGQYVEPPLDFVHSRDEWRSWQESRPPKIDVFNHPLIFSLAHFPKSDEWLFGGIYRVVKRHSDNYEVKLTDQVKGFIGRLILRSHSGRPIYVDFETYYRRRDRFEVLEILREPYSG